MPGDDQKKGLLSGLDLPTIFVGRAGDALSRLVGVPINALAARLERGEANIVARTEGQAAFQKIVADAAAQEAIKNPEFMQRAMETFGRDLIGKQINKDKVAVKAISILKESPSEESIEPNVNDLEVSPDWLNHFSSHAEKASSAEMQHLWAKILAGEIRRPGKYSVFTLSFMANLDLSLAQLVAKYFNHQLGGSLIYHPQNPPETPSYLELGDLQSLGLITTSSSGLHKTIKSKKDGVLKDNEVYIRDGSKHYLITLKDADNQVKLTSLPITSMGLEVLSIVDCMAPDAFCEHIKNQANGQILEMKVTSLPEIQHLIASRK